MTTSLRRLAAALAIVASIALTPRDQPAAAPPPDHPPPPPPLTAKGPVGWDVYRRLDLLPMLPRGVETRQFSSFDRQERNDDFSHCLSRARDGCVIAEHAGTGEIDRMWFTRDFGNVGRTGNIEVELDGRVVVHASVQALVDGVLGPPFVFPLVADAARSSGGNLVLVPMPFRRSMRIVTDADPVYYQVTYRVFADTAGVPAFDPRDPALDVIAKLRAAGAADPKPAQPGAVTSSRDVGLAPGGSAVLADLAGPGAIDALRLRLPPRTPPAVLAGLRVRLTFDGLPAVDAPLSQFFGSGLGGRVAGLLLAMDPTGSGWFSAWWPMPYRSRATVELADETPAAVAFHAEVIAAPDPRWDAWLGAAQVAGYFRADSHAMPTLPGVDYGLLDKTGAGKLVGVSATLRGPRSRVYLEGNERLFVDGARTPQVPGTGTEDFFGGGWYFDFGTFNDPMNGEPANPHETPACAGDCTDAYRVLVGDAVPFGRSIAFGIEHGGHDDVAAAYSSTAFWYGRDGPRLAVVDSVSVAGGTPLTSTYEGNDGPPAPVTMAVRRTSAPVHLELAVPAGNDGVVLRRTSDQDAGYQSATVLVGGQAVGAWLEPLANPFHRWLDDSFLLPANVTAGRTSLDVTLVPTRGSPLWTAARYEALA
jgi:Protein of unknown function (DUF2961)